MGILKKNKKRPPYNFDIKKEYKIYQEVGREKSDYLTYLQWKKHIKEIVDDYDVNNQINFKHYLKGKKRTCKNMLTSVDSIWMPLNVFILTIFLTFVFAVANLIKDYNGDCANVVNKYFNQDKEELYMDTLILLEKNFNESVVFTTIFTLLLIVFGVFLYNIGKYRRTDLAKKVCFYKDVIAIAEETI